MPTKSRPRRRLPESLTVRAVLACASDRLRLAGIQSPTVEAEWLLQHVLGVKRSGLYLDPDRALPVSERDRIDELLSLRCSRIPLQHLTGETEFRSLPFFVNRAVLIPRPETESLVDAALARLRGIVRLLDIGTGSGCIAISLARELPESSVVATDISRPATLVARANAVRNGVADRIGFWVGDLLQAVRPSARFDAILSNPPYIPRGEVETLQPEVRDHEPLIALDGGADGLCVHRRIAGTAGPFLRPGGWLLMEVGDGQMEAVVEVLRGSKAFEEIGQVSDLAGVLRVAVARKA